MAALLALGLSTAPGWRELRWFAACATFASLFNLSNVPINTSPFDSSVLIFATRLNLLFAGLHALTWFKYVSSTEKRPLTRLDRVWVVVGVVLSFLTLVPGLIVGDRVVHRTVSFGTVYRDVPPTQLGFIVVAFYELSIATLFVRALLRRKRGLPRATPHAVALGAVLVCGAHDALAVGGVLDDPYLLDVALIVLVLAVGGSITSSFVANARALEVSSRQLEAAQAQLVNRERLAALGELAAVVAHEVRNPLAVVFNATAGLRRPNVNSGDRDALVSIIQEEAERLRDIVSDLLEFARPRPAVLDDTAIAEIVRGAVETARSVVGVPTSDVVLEVSPNVDRLICDERLVRQAAVNLVTNALQADGRRGPVRVRLAVAHDVPNEIALRVSDDGLGVADDLRERIFTPFFSTRPKGTGLGLAIVRRCADAHQGGVSVSTTPGGGATFELRIPQRKSLNPALSS